MNIHASRNGLIRLTVGETSLELTEQYARIVIACLDSQVDGRSYVDRVKAIVGKAYGYSARQLESHSKPERLCTARFVAFQLCRDADMSSTQIAEAFGSRNHSTVLHGLAVLKARIERSEPLARELDLLRKQLSPA